MHQFKKGDLVITQYEKGVTEKVCNTRIPPLKIPSGTTGWIVEKPADRAADPYRNVFVKLILGGDPVEFYPGYLRLVKEHKHA